MLVLLTNAGWPPHLAPPELLPFHDSPAVQRNANNTAKDGVALYCIQMQKKNVNREKKRETTENNLQPLAMETKKKRRNNKRCIN